MSSSLSLFCVHCARVFKDLEKFRLHTMKHLSWQPFKCYHCADKFFTATTAAAHMTDKHKGRRRLALYKDKPLSKESWYRYLEHALILGANPEAAEGQSYRTITKVPRKLKLVCQNANCSERFKKIGELVNHLIEHIGYWFPLKCPHQTCRMQSNDEDEMVSHLRETHKAKFRANKWIVECAEGFDELDEHLQASLESFQERLRRKQIEEKPDHQAPKDDEQPEGDKDEPDQNDNSSEGPQLDPQNPSDEGGIHPTDRQGEGAEHESDASDNEAVVDVVTVTSDEENAGEERQDDVNRGSGSTANEQLPEGSVKMETSFGEAQQPRQSSEEAAENPKESDHDQNQQAAVSENNDQEAHQEARKEATYSLYVSDDTKPQWMNDIPPNDEPMDQLLDHDYTTSTPVLDRHLEEMEKTASGSGSGELQMIAKREEQPGDGMAPSSSNTNIDGNPRLPLLPRTQVIYGEIRFPTPSTDLSTFLQNLHLYFEQLALQSFVFNHLKGPGRDMKNMDDEVFMTMANVTYADDRNLLEIDFSSGMEEHPIPVFGLADSASRKYRPDGFDYLKKNVFNGTTTLEKDRFKYRCNCQGFCGKDCKCWKMSVLYGKCFIYGRSVIRFLDDFHKSLVIACGPECGCAENCGNRLPAELTKEGLELFERDARIGMGVRTREPIYTGQIVAEVTGEVLRFEKRLPRGAADGRYAWTIYDKKTSLCTPLGYSSKYVQGLRCSQSFPEIGRAVILEVANCGNVARYFTSSEWPNVIPIRVVVNDLRPEAMRFLLMCSRPILPYQEILADYGQKYKLKECLCGMPTCGNGKMVLKKKGADEAMTLLLGIQTQMKSTLPNEERNMSPEEERQLLAKCYKAYTHQFLKQDRIKM